MKLGSTWLLRLKNPKLMVQGVHKAITPDDFMCDLYEMNLKDVMTPEVFKKAVRLTTAPWEKKDGQDDYPINVSIECNRLAAETLLGVGKVYVKWFAFRVRENADHMGCYRCLSFDHRVKESGYSEIVCRRCGQSGYNALKCSNPLNSRNCAFRGRPEGHLIMSAVCPVYAEIEARRAARH